jgi:hypothetical protein
MTLAADHPKTAIIMMFLTIVNLTLIEMVCLTTAIFPKTHARF